MPSYERKGQAVHLSEDRVEMVVFEPPRTEPPKATQKMIDCMLGGQYITTAIDRERLIGILSAMQSPAIQVGVSQDDHGTGASVLKITDGERTIFLAGIVGNWQEYFR